MARTGSGKTAAFVIPMIEKLKEHSVRVGARALVFSPSRELALQTLKVIKEFGKGTDLKTVLLVGGDSLEDQFGMLAGNPDIIVATPGRFLHLKVEMQLDLKSLQYVVFDEADRLFEMGFAAQLNEILYALPATRQTLLFSATLPKTLVEFASAGLQDPALVRLDADAKISQELESAFLSVKSSDKEGALLHLIQDVIQVPRGPEGPDPREEHRNGKKRKRTPNVGKEAPSSYATVVFAATKHHVEYLARFLQIAGYAVSFVYGSLDQVARRSQVAKFRSGQTQILVVTDVAARGIDIPVLSNVINYDFPPQPKVFVHRVGRTARAGRRGWAYSLVRAEDVPYLIDLQLFLGRKLVVGPEIGKIAKTDYDFAQDVICGTFLRDKLESAVEVAAKIISADTELPSMKDVTIRGEKLYTKTKPPAATESVRRAKDLLSQKSWTSVNPLFIEDYDDKEEARLQMLTRVANFRPGETIFEIGQRGLNKSEAAEVMKRRRNKINIDPKREARELTDHDNEDVSMVSESGPVKSHDVWESDSDLEIQDYNSDSDTYEATEPGNSSTPGVKSFEDSEFYLSYTPATSLAEDRAYALNSFAAQAQRSTFDLAAESGGKGQLEPSRLNTGMRWDKKAKKYVRRENDYDGSRDESGKGMIRGESGQRLPATFRSGRFDAWRKAQKIGRLPQVGETEKPALSSNFNGGLGPGAGKRFGKMVHKSEKAPKRPDKFRDDYHIQKKKYEQAKEKGLVGKKKEELKNVDQIRKSRELKEKRREKSNQPGKRGKISTTRGSDRGKPSSGKGTRFSAGGVKRRGKR